MTYSLSRTDIVKITLLFASMGATGCCYSFIFSFYPIVAEAKYLTLTNIGIVLSACPASTIIFGFPCGFLITKVGPRLMLVFSITSQALVLIPFAFIDVIDDRNAFYATSVGFRILQGMLYVSTQLAAFSVASSDFTNNINLVVGLLETGLCVGLSLGPALGGLLFQIYGFKIPFILTCCITLVVSLLDLCYLHPKYNFHRVGEEHDNLMHQTRLKHTDEFSRKLFFKIPSLMLPLMNCFLLYSNWTFFDVALAHQVINKFGKSSAVVGAIFLAFAGCYAIASPIVGAVVDKKRNFLLVMTIGCFTIATGYMLLGPAPFTHIKRSFPLLTASMILIGISGTFMYVPGMGMCHDILINNNIEVDKQAHAFLASSFVLASNIGGFTGSLLGGVLVDQVGFEWSSSIFGSVNVLMGSCNVLYAMRK